MIQDSPSARLRLAALLFNVMLFLTAAQAHAQYKTTQVTSRSAAPGLETQSLNLPPSGAPVTFTISASAGYGGIISPPGNIKVSSGGTMKFTIRPDSEYSVFLVTVDGAPLGKILTYTFSNITGNHTIKASFIKKRKWDWAEEEEKPGFK